MEQRCQFNSDDLILEGLLKPGSSSHGLIVTHPHPLYGGDMANPVVATITQALAAPEDTTLRFNFRGVGNSEGAYADGVGEQRDVLAAVHWLAARGLESIHLAGYSFGSWINARMASDRNISLPLPLSLTLVAPPVAFLDFSDMSSPSSLERIVAGERDEYAPPDQIRRILEHWQSAAPLVVIPRANHFFSGCLEQLAAALRG